MKNPEVISSFGPHLRKLREKHDMSQQELADEADIAKKTIQKIETGRLNPSLDILASIAKGFQIRLTELVDFGY